MRRANASDAPPFAARASSPRASRTTAASVAAFALTRSIPRQPRGLGEPSRSVRGQPQGSATARHEGHQLRGRLNSTRPERWLTSPNAADRAPPRAYVRHKPEKSTRDERISARTRSATRLSGKDQPSLRLTEVRSLERSHNSSSPCEYPMLPIANTRSAEDPRRTAADEAAHGRVIDELELSGGDALREEVLRKLSEITTIEHALP